MEPELSAKAWTDVYRPMVKLKGRREDEGGEGREDTFNV